MLYTASPAVASFWCFPFTASDCVEWLIRLLDGTADHVDVDVERLRRGARTWINTARRSDRDDEGRLRRPRPVSLSRCLGLPDNPEIVRIGMRDYYVRRAATELGRTLHAGRSLPAALCAEARHFLLHRWLCWCEFDFPPPNARELDRLLFLAAKASGGSLPKSARQYANILKP